MRERGRTRREAGDIVPRLHPNYLILPETGRNPGYSASNVGLPTFELSSPSLRLARRDGAIPSFFPTPTLPPRASREKDGVGRRREKAGNREERSGEEE